MGEKLEIISKVYLSLFTVFGGFAPNLETAEVMSKNLGEQTILSGSITQSKNDGSKSLQMMSRALMTVDELKTMPRFHFIISKTGCNPMRTKLDLFFKWGIELNNEYEPDKNRIREVRYAGKDDLIAEIERREGRPSGSFGRYSRRSESGGMSIPSEPIEEMNSPQRGGIRVDGQKHYKA